MIDETQIQRSVVKMHVMGLAIEPIHHSIIENP
jgi:hypothetical protein